MMWTHIPGHEFVGQINNYLEDIQPGLSLLLIGGLVTSAAVSYVTVRGYRYHQSCQIARERGQAGKQACENLKRYLNQQEAQYGPVNKQKEAMIMKLDLQQLTEKLRKGELKAVEVLRAYQRKAMEVNDKLNCVTEPILEAEERAKQLDLIPPDQRGPLHGVPFSIKESFNIKGYDCHCGLAFFANKPVDTDADIVTLLKSLGAVPFVRTNEPQLLVSDACSNPIFGRTHNPYNVRRGPGGSSGGEGALIGAGGSIIGIGSDIGGSVRIPAQMCGIYTIKPTVERIVNRGHMPLSTGQTLLRGTLGPMTRDMDGLIMLSRELLNPRNHSYSPSIPPLPFNDELFEKKGPLRIGYYTGIEEIHTHPGCVRAIMEAKAALERKGHKVVQFAPPRVLEAVAELHSIACSTSGGKSILEYLDDDKVDGCLKPMYYMTKIPLFLAKPLALLYKFLDPESGTHAMVVFKIPRTVTDWCDFAVRMEDYKAEFYQAWKSLDLDAVICPGQPFPALTAGIEGGAKASIVYTALYNVLNYPAGMMPVTTVTERDVQRLNDLSVYPPSGVIEKLIIKDSDGTVGLPLAVQCVALPYQEEIVLRVMKDIETGIRK